MEGERLPLGHHPPGRDAPTGEGAAVALDPADWWELASRRVRYTVLTSAKHLLGNQRYDRLRRRLLHSTGT